MKWQAVVVKWQREESNGSALERGDWCKDKRLNAGGLPVSVQRIFKYSGLTQRGVT